jgi:hypothetical protein
VSDKSFIKDPNARLDYYLAWGSWLALAGSDTLTTVAVSADSGITVESSEIVAAEITLDGLTYPANSVVRLWLSGGTAGERYEVRVSVTTALGREDDRSIDIVVRER